jgi:hypothetical protein
MITFIPKQFNPEQIMNEEEALTQDKGNKSIPVVPISLNNTPTEIKNGTWDIQNSKNLTKYSLGTCFFFFIPLVFLLTSDVCQPIFYGCIHNHAFLLKHF